MKTKVLAFALVAWGLAALGASCALPFWSLPAADGAGGASGSTTAESSSTGLAMECESPGPSLCGSSTEQCNDQNAFRLDGCNEACRYEVVQRMSDLRVSADAGPSFCVHAGNRFGQAIDAMYVESINQPVADNLLNGSLNILTHFHCLSDLGGANASNFTIGVSNGFLDPSRGLWPTGPAPKDWSFLVDGSALTAGTETYQLSPATIVNNALSAGPSSIKMNFPLAGANGSLKLDHAIIHATVDPTTSRPGPPELTVAPNLLVFEAVTATAQDQGLCGDITVQSLAQIAVPPLIAMGSLTACVEGYHPCASDMVVGPSCNSLLDVIVGGCTFGATMVAHKTQPDVPGHGALVAMLVADATSHKVTVPAGDDDAYSAYFTFAMRRQHIAGVWCTTPNECQSGQTCVANVCTPR